jgi:uncharacterized protein
MSSGRWCDFERLIETVAAQFASGADSVHGPFHWRRVEQHGIWLSTQTQADELVVRLFAWFHDCCRINDFTDPGHGKRGADFAASQRGKLFDLDDDAFAQLGYACIWHTDRDFTDQVTVATCWDADRLDLGRVGAIPSEALMNTAFGKEVARAGSFYSFLEICDRPARPMPPRPSAL